MNRKLRCAVIDDEPLAVELMESYVRRTPFLQFEGSFGSGTAAFESLHEHPVELLYCDIQMPELNGMDLTRMLPPATRVIFTTAFDRYAVEVQIISDSLIYIGKDYNHISRNKHEHSVSERFRRTAVKRQNADWKDDALDCIRNRTQNLNHFIPFRMVDNYHIHRQQYKHCTQHDRNNRNNNRTPDCFPEQRISKQLCISSQSKTCRHHVDPLLKKGVNQRHYQWEKQIHYNYNNRNL